MPLLEKFRSAYRETYAAALYEVKCGKKRSHWMWFIFPQLKGLGHSPTAQFYGLNNLAEAEAFLSDDYLGSHLVEICEALRRLEGRTASQIFGYPDDLKLQSSMTLFCRCQDAPPVFSAVLTKYFRGVECKRTLEFLNGTPF